LAKKISATEAARRFSELLNRVGFRGERYTIARGGKAVATLGPVTGPVTRTLGELPDLLKKLSPLGDDTKSFARDVSRGVRKAPRAPRKAPWA
jgi:antitoxin (DNA-binding transcriptional repressor) of toxin-antitoxin stability system